MKELLKQRKVQLGIAGVAAVAVIGGGYAIYEANKVSIDYVLNDNVVEYGEDQSKIDWLKRSTTNGNKITASNFDIKKVGQTDVVFLVCVDDKCAEYTQKVEIKDTKKPVIKLKKDKVEISVSDKFDPASNIESVKDTVDGDIKKSDDKKLTKNGYIITSDVDTKKAGSYSVKVTAYDVNGNKEENSYKVTVKEKPEEPKTSQNQTPQQTSQATHTPPTTPTQGSNSIPPSNSGTTNTNKPQENNQPHVHSGKPVGGMYFDDPDKLDEWAVQYRKEQVRNGIDIGAAYGVSRCSCGMYYINMFY